MEHVTGSSRGWSILPLCLWLVTYRLDRDHISTAMFRNDHCNHSLLLDCCFWLHVCRFDRAPCIHLQVGDYGLCHMPQSVGGAVSLQCSCRYKIQPEKNAPLEMKKLMKVVRHVLVNQVKLPIGAEYEVSKVQRKGDFKFILLSKPCPRRWCWVYPWACWASPSGAPDPRPGRTHWGSCPSWAPCWHTSWSVDI